ncbi:RNA-binding protein [Lactobacillus sp. DCY120]|uniref:RNA-binding protein n=1 Tax=Bombilactobacillus apium TaxID=2675299 RepID=A0A850R516_9LACO|nr:YlmH/Sll1252 family protein [Bombilactobacillus apium]NVY95682.1 RNA-binding protein [Bombilactobacillus apium]
MGSLTNEQQQLQTLIQNAARYDSPQLSAFLDPKQQQNAAELLNGYPQLTSSFFGGYPQAQRQRLLIQPDYFATLDLDWKIQLFEIKFNQKFIKLHHNQILGKLMNLGLARGVFGDIITDGQRWQFFAIQQFQTLLIQEVQQIGPYPVHVITLDLQQQLQVRDNAELSTLVVASLRLDSIVATGFHLTRQQAKKLIRSGQVLLNGEYQRQVDTTLTRGDIVSCHRCGQLMLVEILGMTATQKYKIYTRIHRL